MIAAFERMIARTAEAASVPKTLGDILYASGMAIEAEANWTMLIREVAAGNKDALLSLYDRMQPMVFTLAKRATVDHAKAEIATLNVFIRIWEEAAHFKSGSSSIA
jgi:hypothetical protein